MTKIMDNVFKIVTVTMLVFLLLLSGIFLFINFRNTINDINASTETITDTVQVVDSDEYVTGGTIVLVGKTPVCTPSIIHHIITVKYKDKEYDIDDDDTYEQFKNKKGQNVKAMINKITYKNKKVKYEMKELYEDGN